MNRQKITVAISIGAIILLIGIFAVVAGTGIYDRLNPGLGRISSGRIGVSKEEAHADAGNQRQSLCVKCHGEMRTKKTPWHKIHMLITFVSFECSTCHKRVNTMARSLKGKVLIDRSVCPRCHRQKFPAFNEEHQKITWIQRHRLLRGEKTGGADIYSMPVLIQKYPECFICHEKKELSFCQDCHAYHPHNYEWVNDEHGKRALATDFSCLRCHEKTTWCSTQCHKGITLPHNIPKWANHYTKDTVSPLWLRAHPYVADSFGISQTGDFRASDPGVVCSMCHNKNGAGANFCQQCHHKEFDKVSDQPTVPWKPKHPSVVKEIGSTACQRCHLLEFCAYCHTNSRKPERGLFFNRRQQKVPTKSQESDVFGD